MNMKKIKKLKKRIVDLEDRLSFTQLTYEENMKSQKWLVELRSQLEAEKRGT